MRTTTLPLLMGLISALAHAQDSGGPSATPSAPNPTAPSTGPAPAPAPVSPPSGSGAMPPTEEPSPFVFGIRQGLTGESNLFRAPEGSPLERRDRIWSSGVHLGLDKSLGRQHFFFDAEANHNRYNKNEHLNNTDYGVNARWDWETVGRLSGLFSAQQRQSLYRDTINGTISLERNQVRSTALGFQARVGLVTRWSFEVGATGSENDYRGVDVDDRDMRQTSFNAGVRFRQSGALTTRLGVRRSEGRYPGGLTGVEDEFTRDDVDLITNLTATGASALNSRISLTRESHTARTARDNRGWTGALGWNWRPTGKLYTDLDLAYDRSVGRADFDSTLTGGESSDARAISTASLAVSWLATAKLTFAPRVSWAYRKLDNSFVTGVSTATGSDTTVSGGLSMTYVPIDALRLVCHVTQERRRVGGDTTVSTPYEATVAGCNAEFAIR
jgi:hypothetical protein